MLVACLELLDWDELTYMPPGGVEERSLQLAYVTGLLHTQATEPRIGELLAMVEGSELVANPHSDAAINVRCWRRSYDRHTRTPRSLVEELARVTVSAQQAWAVARQNADFGRFLPWLERVVRLKQAEARCLGGSGEPYDALLGDYEPHATAAELACIFAELRSHVTPLLAAIAQSPRRIRSNVLRRDYPIERQRVFLESVATELGFDFDRGRLDATTHPFFSSIGPGDCRFTTRYDARDFGEAFFSMLHELGHGLYEQGLDPTHAGTPRGEAPSLGLHESQSRLWENAIGRSLPFWKHFFPRAREVFHDSLRDVSAHEFYLAVNQVQPGWNRVRADEVSYDLHILVRFELERALITGDLAPRDLPAAWNEKYAQVLGVRVAHDGEGCLQDGHWSAGQFGYFPTYTLGNLDAAQFMAALRRDLPDLEQQIAQGQFGDLLGWLRDRVYRVGQRFTAPELVQHVTGLPPGCATFVAALRQKFSEIYGL